jgi:hypothetical protein
MSGLNSEQALELAQQLFAIGDLQGALSRCGEILAHSPEHGGARELSAAIHGRSGMIAGYCLNLEKRSDRVEECLRNRAEFGFPEGMIGFWKAVLDSDFGAIGAGKSHIAALTDFFLHGTSPYCMVLEDDFDFLRPAADLFEVMLRIKASGLRWDVLLLTGNDVIPFEQPQAAPFLLRVLEAQSGAGYIVNRPYLPTLLACFLETVAQLERFRGFNPRKAVVQRFALDIAWKNLQRRDHWYIVNPSFGHQRPSHSDIEGDFRDYRRGTFYKWP